MTHHHAYPPIPATVDAPAGPVRVEIIVAPPAWHEEATAQCGEYDDWIRCIRIDGTLELPMQWATLFHELAHTAMMDAGLHHLFSDPQQEALCDALATARLRERSFPA